MRARRGAHPLLRWFDGRDALGFVAAAVLLGVASSAIYDFFVRLSDSRWLLVVIAVAALGLLALLGWWFGRRFERRFGREAPTLAPDKIAQPHRALIAFVSRGAQSIGHVRKAIRHHMRDNTLECCWLVYTEESIDNFNSLVSEFDDAVRLDGRQLSDPNEVSVVYTMVNGILNDIESNTSDRGPRLADVIVDITGGPKPTTAGAVLACYQRGVDMQYVYSQFDQAGKLLEETSVVRTVEFTRSRNGQATDAR